MNNKRLILLTIIIVILTTTANIIIGGHMSPNAGQKVYELLYLLTGYIIAQKQK